MLNNLCNSIGQSAKKTFFTALTMGLLLACSHNNVLAAILNDNGDFADFGAQTVGTAVQTPPWSFVSGANNVIATAAQSPFVNVFGTPNARGANTPEATGGTNAYFVDTFASTPAGATGFLYFNADFRNNSLGAGGAYSMLVTDGAAGAAASAALYVSGTSLYKQSSPGTNELVTGALVEDAWYNVQLAINLNTNQYSGKLTPLGGSTVPIPLTNFITENAISGIYSDGGTAAGFAGLSNNATLQPDHDLDNFVLSTTPLAAVNHNANTALKTFELNTSGAVAGVNGDWQYGTSPTASGTFTPFPAPEHNDAITLPGIAAGNLQGWQEDTGGDLVPAVAVNVTNGSITSGCCGTYDLDEIWIHSGPGGSGRDFSIVRWTAPLTGVIDYSATFINEGGTSAPWSVLINGVAQFSGNAAGSDLATGTTTNGYNIPVTAGTTIDFAVGGYNSVGLYADVIYVPEPASLTLVVFGLFAATFAWRRRAPR